MTAEQEKENIDALQKEIQGLEQELREQADEITARWDEVTTKVESVPVTPRRTDIEVHVFALAWAPYWQVGYRDRSGSVRSETLPAY
jgi:predicted nuclease with TOPRIM domain